MRLYEGAIWLLRPDGGADSPGIVSETLGAVLRESIDVLGELLASLNETVFENHIKVRIRG